MSLKIKIIGRFGGLLITRQKRLPTDFKKVLTSINAPSGAYTLTCRGINTYPYFRRPLNAFYSQFENGAVVEIYDAKNSFSIGFSLNAPESVTNPERFARDLQVFLEHI